MADRRVHDEVPPEKQKAFEQVYQFVRTIPPGQVVNYGQIATELGNRLSARAVGWAMHGCPEGVPWHRVVNASGGLSTEHMPNIVPGMQRHLLEEEGIEFKANGKLDIDRYRFLPHEKNGS